jgi:L-iditol 2-dehydrogenase
MAEEHGATLAIDATRQDPVRAILEATNHRGADVVFEAAGAPEGPYQAVKMTKGGGTVVVVGIPAEDHLLVPATESRRKEVTIKVSRRMRHMYPRTIALVEQRMVRVDSLITHILPLDQGAHGFAILDAYAENVGKVVLRNE